MGVVDFFVSAFTEQCFVTGERGKLLEDGRLAGTVGTCEHCEVIGEVMLKYVIFHQGKAVKVNQLDVCDFGHGDYPGSY